MLPGRGRARRLRTRSSYLSSLDLADSVSAMNGGEPHYGFSSVYRSRQHGQSEGVERLEDGFPVTVFDLSPTIENLVQQA